MENELTLLIGKGEKILYAGKPDKRCFIFECIFNPLLPFALIWGLFDMFFIGAAFSSDKADGKTDYKTDAETSQETDDDGCHGHVGRAFRGQVSCQGKAKTHEKSH